MSNTPRPFVIDADGHIVEPTSMWAEYVEPAYRARAPRPALDERGHPCQVIDDRIIMRHAMLLTFGPEYKLEGKTFQAGGWDPQARLRDMDSEGIDIAVLYPSIGFYIPELNDVPLMAALCRAYNNWLADYCRAAPDRLVGVALLPLHDIDESIRELTRATEQLGFRGAFFRPNPHAGRPIHHPAYDRFWECAASLGVPIAVHEGLSDSLPTLGRDRFENPALLHVLSHPFEQMAACAGLIMTGVMDRHPSLRFAFLESGSGWLPYWLERLDSHFDTWEKFFPLLRLKPSEYFKRQCVISTEPSDEIVDAVVHHVSDECVVWASDYPHPDAHFPGAVTKTLASMANIAPASRDKILATNAARVYGITLPARERAR
ncbi:MAG: amidohydrolase [Deltaproteobacteria bacterium]|nr:amidohydrolase [Deltaproteobacteria bacterium]MBI3387209.1 amidohydrolase [Deltaproteobacteria bacterium]